MIHEYVNQALEAYSRIAGLDPSNYWKSVTIEELNEASELDHSGLTVFMLLQGLADTFLDETNFSAKEIFTDPDKFHKRMKEFKELKNVLEAPEVSALTNEFHAKVLGTVKKYGAPLTTIQAVEKMFTDPNNLSCLRRDALRSLENLEAHQFLQGKPETDKLSLNRYVWEFWNVNSLVRALRDQNESGVSLVLIRDPQEVLSSFFVFGVKNGENVTILTDRDHAAHPLQTFMRRKPDRDLSRRAQRNWFPYNLLDLAQVIGEDIFGQSVVTGLYEKMRTGLVPYDSKGLRLAEIKNLEPAELVWLSLTAERIDERYGKLNHKLPQLSYTGEMVVLPHALASPEGSLVRSGAYTPLATIALKSTDVTRETTNTQWEHTQTGINNWIEDRYAAQVPDRLLNVVGEQNLLRLEKDVGLRKKGRRDGLDIESRDTADLVGFDPVAFGTEDEIRKDVVWMGRYNQALMLDHLAKEEFEKTKHEPIKFWDERIKLRKSALVQAAAMLNFPSTSRKYKIEHGAGPCGKGRGEVDSWGNIPVDLPVNLAKQFKSQPRWSGHQMALFESNRSASNNKWKCICAVNGKTAAYYVNFSPDCPRALADLLGITVEELPWQMQNWFTVEPYGGNNILSRIDPLDWKVDNPWTKLKFTVTVCFSKSGLNAIRKDLGLPRIDSPPDCSECSNKGGGRHYGRDWDRSGKCRYCGREYKA